jgi:hypothetical protein
MATPDPPRGTKSAGLASLTHAEARGHITEAHKSDAHTYPTTSTHHHIGTVNRHSTHTTTKTHGWPHGVTPTASLTPQPTAPHTTVTHHTTYTTAHRPTQKQATENEVGGAYIHHSTHATHKEHAEPCGYGYGYGCGCGYPTHRGAHTHAHTRSH